MGASKLLKNGAGDGARTRDVQLGNILFRCKQRTYAPKAMITGNLRPHSFRHLPTSGSLTQ